MATKQSLLRQRGCGWPIKGGTYISKEFDETNPLDLYRLDPTYPLPEDFGMSFIGMTLKERLLEDGVTVVLDVWDWIGEDAYPNVPDIVEEWRQLGFHQKVNPSILQKLSPESYYLAVHARASFLDPTVMWEKRRQHPHLPLCPKELPQHMELDPNVDPRDLGTCPGLFLSDVREGTAPTSDGVVVRHMPSFDWDGYAPVDPDVEYVPAAFFSFPIGLQAEFLVYEDIEGGLHDHALEELRKMDERLQRITLVSLEQENT